MTTTKTPSEQADEIVEMFRDTCTIYEWTGRGYNVDELTTIKCQTIAAVKHVTGIIEVLERIPPYASIREFNHYQQILTILKEKL